MTSILIDRYIDVIELNPDALNNRELRKIRFKPEHYGRMMEIHLLKGITWRYVIHNRSLSMQQHGKKRIICDLFEMFFKAIDSDDEEAKYILPEDYQIRLNEILDDMQTYEPDEEKRTQQAKARLVADIVSSFNDNEAMLVHKRLTGFEPGSFLQKLHH